MAMHAYIDLEREKVLFARNAVSENKDTRFYCPNSDCDAHMHVRHRHGLKYTYFAAKSKVYPHVEGCPFGARSKFKPYDFMEGEFHFEEVALGITQRDGNLQTPRKSPAKQNNDSEPIKLPPHTLHQIYNMCISHHCKDVYNNQVIGWILIDKRSLFMYPKGVFGWRIIEGKRKRPEFYDSRKKEIYITLNADNSPYSFILKFEDENLFKTVKNKIYNNKDKLILAIAHWEKSGEYNVFSGQIISKAQVAVTLTS